MTSIRAIKSIVGRELYAYLFSPVAYVFIALFLGLVGCFTFFLGRFFDAGQATLEPFFIWHPWLFMMLVPAIGMRIWSEEKRNGTMELLLTLPLNQWHAVVGKYIAGAILLLVALLLTLPVPLTVNYLGDPDWGVIATSYLGSFLVATAFLAVSCMTSAMTRNQVVSFIISLCVCLFLILSGYDLVTDAIRNKGAVPYALMFIIAYGVIWGLLALLVASCSNMFKNLGEGGMLWALAIGISLVSAVICVGFMYLLQGGILGMFEGGTPEWVVDAAAGFSVSPYYYDSLVKGIVDTRAMVYFASLIAFCLITCNVILTQRRAQ